MVDELATSPDGLTELGHALALRIIAAADSRGAVARLFGGLAVWDRCPNSRHLWHRSERRTFDIDLIAQPHHKRPLEEIVTANSFTRVVSVPRSQARGWFSEFRQVGGPGSCHIFYGQFSFSHRVPLPGLNADYPTIPLAELLLSKLQIHEFTEKDASDVCMLLREHPLGDSGREVISVNVLARVCAGDWPLYQTVSNNLARIERGMSDSPSELTGDSKAQERLNALVSLLSSCQKTLRWRARNWLAAMGIGDKHWWRDVDPL